MGASPEEKVDFPVVEVIQQPFLPPSSIDLEKYGSVCTCNSDHPVVLLPSLTLHNMHAQV